MIWMMGLKDTDNTKLLNTMEGRPLLQMDMDREGEWVSKSSMKFNKDKHRILYLHLWQNITKDPNMG